MNAVALVVAFVGSMMPMAVAPAQVSAAAPSVSVAPSAGASIGSYENLALAMASLVCSTPTLDTGAATSPYVSGSGAITLTANSTCAGGTQYRFLYRDTSLVWHYISTYGSSNTTTWSADFKAGRYFFQVRARPVGSASLYATYTNLGFTLTGCGVPALTSDPLSPQLAATAVTWTASTTCSGAAQYKFMVRNPAGGWRTPQDWGASATLSWLSPATRGSYLVQVLVRNSGAAHDAYDNYKAVPFVVGLCTTPGMDTGIAASPYATGSGAVTFTGYGSCQGGVEYRWLYRDTGLVWHYLTGYVAGNTVSWKADYKPGPYVLEVRTRPVGSSVAYVTFRNLTFNLTGCGAASLVPNFASPQNAASRILWTATASCSGTPEYKFLVRSSYCGAPANPWTYNLCGGATIKFPPTTICSYFHCIASFWLNTSGYVALCVDGKYSHSGGVTGACSGHGGERQPLYNGFWTVGQNWSTTATFDWSSPPHTGPFVIEVLVRNSGANDDPYDHYKEVSYTLK